MVAKILTSTQVALPKWAMIQLLNSTERKKKKTIQFRVKIEPSMAFSLPSDMLFPLWFFLFFFFFFFFPDGISTP